MTKTNCVPGFEIDDDPPVLPPPPARSVKPRPNDTMTTPTPSVPPANRSLIDNHEFLADCSRYLEGLYTCAQVKKRWRNINNATWDLLGDDNELVDAIEQERTRRIRSGEAKRELAQKHIATDGPNTLHNIICNERANDKHRIDAVKALDSLTGNPVENEQRDRIIIKIDLSADTKDPKDVHIIEATTRPNITPQEE